MSLMKILNDCENQLGWIPKDKDLFKARAVMHRIVTKALAKQGYTTEDLALAVAYCRRKRLPIDSPLQLLPLIKDARAAAPAQIKPHSLDVQTSEAVLWENAHLDPESLYWIGRLTRSSGPARADTLTEWREAGRG